MVDPLLEDLLLLGEYVALVLQCPLHLLHLEHLGLALLGLLAEGAVSLCLPLELLDARVFADNLLSPFFVDLLKFGVLLTLDLIDAVLGLLGPLEALPLVLLPELVHHAALLEPLLPQAVLGGVLGERDAL